LLISSYFEIHFMANYLLVSLLIALYTVENLPLPIIDPGIYFDCIYF